MTKRRNYEELPDTELSPEEDERLTAMVEQANRELEETRVSFRWGKDQLELVKRAARAMGVPYQTFIKLAVFERAAAVLQSVESIGKPGDAA